LSHPISATRALTVKSALPAWLYANGMMLLISRAGLTSLSRFVSTVTKLQQGGITAQNFCWARGSRRGRKWPSNGKSGALRLPNS
jgi:hypothetical protein